jgi:hypothetical protein
MKKESIAGRVGEIHYEFGNHSGKSLYPFRSTEVLIRLRRLVVLSVLLILGGLALLLPSSALYNLITTGSTSSGSTAVVRFGAAAASTTSDNTTTIESLLGFGLIGVGVVLELLSLFTDVGAALPSGTTAQAEMAPPSPINPAPSAASEGKKP